MVADVLHQQQSRLLLEAEALGSWQGLSLMLRASPPRNDGQDLVPAFSRARLRLLLQGQSLQTEAFPWQGVDQCGILQSPERIVLTWHRRAFKV